MKSFFLLFATVAMVVAADVDTVIQESSIRMESLVVCADQSTTCPSGSTCCKLIGGDYGCCESPETKEARVSSTAVEDPTPVNIVCPGGGRCARRAACCRTYSGTYTCCNYPYTVCCDGGKVCCLRGYVCNAGLCTRGLAASPWQELTGVKASMSQPAP